MRKMRALVIGVGALTLLSFAALSIDQSQWKGKIESIDGVKVVRNPNSPVFGDIKFELQEANMAKKLKDVDAVIIATDHTCYDYPWIVKNAKLVIDTRNAVKRARKNVVKA
jgi:UDP-N-acetyl-D-mannosaminuronate dehydrogenase